jgi:hypothetical protein
MIGLKRVLDVEAALSWAYVDELPKRKSDYDFGGGGFNSVSPMFSMCALGGRVDNWSREPGFPAAAGPPHPDALLIEAAVERLGTAPLSCENYGDELVGLVDEPDSFGRLALRGIVNLVRIRAKLGDRPSLGEAPVCGPWKNENGSVSVRRIVTEWINDVPHAQEVASPAMRKGVYHSGAYCPLRWSPAPRETMLERAEYAAWHAALTWLAGELEELGSIRVTAPAASSRPWREPATVTLSVLPDLREVSTARRRRRVAA